MYMFTPLDHMFIGKCIVISFVGTPVFTGAIEQLSYRCRKHSVYSLVIVSKTHWPHKQLRDERAQNIMGE